MVSRLKPVLDNSIISYNADPLQVLIIKDKVHWIVLFGDSYTNQSWRYIRPDKVFFCTTKEFVFPVSYINTDNLPSYKLNAHVSEHLTLVLEIELILKSPLSILEYIDSKNMEKYL